MIIFGGTVLVRKKEEMKGGREKAGKEKKREEKERERDTKERDRRRRQAGGKGGRKEEQVQNSLQGSLGVGVLSL